jgi:hypothetical protein
MAQISERFASETLWPEFESLRATMQDYYDDESRH